MAALVIKSQDLKKLLRHEGGALQMLRPSQERSERSTPQVLISGEGDAYKLGSKGVFLASVVETRMPKRSFRRLGGRRPPHAGYGTRARPDLPTRPLA